MIRTLRAWAVALIFSGLIGGSFMTITSPQATSAAACQDKVLSFPTWYRGLSKQGSGGADTCDIKSPAELNTPGKPPGEEDGLTKFIWIIVLNGIEIAMQVVAYLAVGFIIYGGFKYITGAGASDKIVTGRKLILNAVIGLVISLFAVAIVNIVLRSFP